MIENYFYNFLMSKISMYSMFVTVEQVHQKNSHLISSINHLTIAISHVTHWVSPVSQPGSVTSKPQSLHSHMSHFVFKPATRDIYI